MLKLIRNSIRIGFVFFVIKFEEDTYSYDSDKSVDLIILLNKKAVLAIRLLPWKRNPGESMGRLLLFIATDDAVF